MYSVRVFSSHSFWTSSSLDVPAGVTQEEGHTQSSSLVFTVLKFLFQAAEQNAPPSQASVCEGFAFASYTYDPGQFELFEEIRTHLDLLSIPQSGGKKFKTFRYMLFMM